MYQLSVKILGEITVQGPFGPSMSLSGMKFYKL